MKRVENVKKIMSHAPFIFTFGSPYTHKGSGNPPATYVKNVINEDDPLIKKISDENDYSRLGEIYNASIKLDYMDKYRTYIGVSPSEYKGDCSRMNTMISQFIKFVKGEPSTREVLLAALSKNTGNGSTSVTMSPLTTVVNDATIEISNTNDAQKDGSSIKSYYVLSKVLEGVNKEGRKDDKYQQINEQSSSDINENEENDKRNGYPFVAYKDDLLGKDVFDMNRKETAHINAYKYSNYTMPKEYKENDVNYTKFWNREDNGKLSKYKMGNYNNKTKFTNEKKSKYFDNFVNNGGGFRTYNDSGIWTIDGRIVAAFPSALKGEEKPEFKRTLDDMHLISTHDKTNIVWQRNDKGVNSQKDGGWFLDGNSYSLGINNMYKLVDCVFEDGNKQQFVVPFIVIDDKMIHLLPNMYDVHYYLDDGISRGGMMGNLTDNRYGQVTEYIENENPIRYEYNYLINISGDGTKDKIIKKSDCENERFDKLKYIDNLNPITYFDKTETRVPITLSPIEPLTNCDMDSKDIMTVIFGDDSNDYRLISMRLYKENTKVANQAGIPQNGIWGYYKELIVDEPNYIAELNAEQKKNIIVKYN